MENSETRNFPEGYQLHLDRMAQAGAEVRTSGLEGVRLRYDLWGEKVHAPYPIGMRVRNSSICFPGYEIPIRVYWPAQLGEQPPVIVFFHGGGFVGGSIDSHDHITSLLAQEVRAVVVSVQYRKPPENPYPAPQDDCYAALKWVVEHASMLGYDATRVSVAGDSAGALISTAVSMMARDRGGPSLRHQALLYGVYDVDMERSYYKTAPDKLLTLPMMLEFSAAYLPGEAIATRDPYAVPLRATTEQLRGLPPALLVNGTLDILYEEECEYARRLREAGVAVREIVVENVMHGFLRAWDLSPVVRSAFYDMAAEIRLHLA